MGRYDNEIRALSETISSQKESIGRLQDVVSRRARKNPLPPRFKSKRVGTDITIHDTQTGRRVTIALCFYAGARQVLNGLFGSNSNKY